MREMRGGDLHVPLPWLKLLLLSSPPLPTRTRVHGEQPKLGGNEFFSPPCFFCFWMVVSHLDASPPRPWREEVPEAKTGNLLVYYQLQNCCFDTRGPGGSHFLGFDNDLQTDLKSSKLIFPSPSWSRSANMMSLSPCVLKYDVAVPLRFVFHCQCHN